MMKAIIMHYKIYLILFFILELNDIGDFDVENELMARKNNSNTFLLKIALIMINISNAKDCFLYWLINCSKNYDYAKVVVVMILMIMMILIMMMNHMRDEKLPSSTAPLLQDKESWISNLKVTLVGRVCVTEWESMLQTS